jgi:decaprenylphospho-beta-D-ribofuranose 2-oxidase
MPPPELAPARPATAGRTTTTVAGWGRRHPAAVRLTRPGSVDELQRVVAGARPGSAVGGSIPRGLGRSYGDAAQLVGGLVIETAGLSAFRLDPATGVVTADAGVSLGDLLRAVVPRGWIVPVVPGTQHVTIGGALASDVHGKDHLAAGTFSRHVHALGLVRSDGELVTLAPGDPAGLFEATVGGMGLTGVIAWARLRLLPLAGATMAVDTERVSDLGQACAALIEPGRSHRVAWLDLLAGRPGRGVVTRADLVDAALGRRADAATVSARATVPARWGHEVLRPALVRAFNELRFRRAPRRESGHPVAFGAFSFPLDALDGWPGLYGRGGLVQYQFAVPHGHEAVLEQVIARLRAAAVPCYLAVLKLLGPANPSPLSFPLAGFTLALDLPGAVPGLQRLLRSCDELVAEAGGRVYLTKDAHLDAAATSAMYPRLGEWRATRDAVDPVGLWRSDLAVRTGLVDAA